VAWFTQHVHQDTLNMPYQYAYLYKYGLNANKETEYIQLPDNPSIKIFAITAALDKYDDAEAVQPLYDDFSDRKTMQLVLPKRISTPELIPQATIKTDDNSDLSKLLYRPTMKDYADLHMPAGVTVKYFFSGTEKKEGYKPEKGMSAGQAVDGMFDLLPADSAKDIWFEQGESRIVMDLQKTLEIDSLHLFTQESLKRGAQAFSMWGSDQPGMPSAEGDPKAAGWHFIVYSQAIDIWQDNKAVYSITPENNKALKYRYLMWVSEETPHGPYYFREIDVFEKQ
jgi:CheY-like chemotaxis protein